MKKFAFTNEKYLGIKINEYDALKRDMENVDKEIEAVKREIEALDERFERERESHNDAFKKGVSADKLRAFQFFFPYIRELKEDANRRIAELQLKRQRISEKLFKTHNEIKVLEQMKEDQYHDYLKELATEENKELDTHISFTIYKGEN